MLIHQTGATAHAHVHEFAAKVEGEFDPLDISSGRDDDFILFFGLKPARKKGYRLPPA
jgi:hypothetical protein